MASKIQTSSKSPPSECICLLPKWKILSSKVIFPNVSCMTPFRQFMIAFEVARNGLPKDKSVAVERDKGNTFLPAKNSNPYVRPFGVKFYKCREVGDEYLKYSFYPYVLLRFLVFLC